MLDTQAGYSKMAEVTGLTGGGTLESWYLMISYSVDARPAVMVSPVKQMQIRAGELLAFGQQRAELHGNPLQRREL